MGESYQIRDQEQVYFFTFQVVGWADVFTRKAYRDVILQSLDYCRKEKGMLLYAYVIMSNHVHLIIRSEIGDFSGVVRDFKKFTSKKLLSEILTNKKESRREWLEMIFKYHAKNNKRAGNMQFWTHEFQMKKGTLDELISIGLRNDDTPKISSYFPEMNKLSPTDNWTLDNALFKTEGNKYVKLGKLDDVQINIGLGKGKALKIFNKNIIHFQELE